MSGDRWRYTPEKCDGDFCPSECDNCPKCWEDADDDEEEIAYGGSITLDETTELKELDVREQTVLTLTQMEKRKDYVNAAITHHLITMLKGDDDDRHERNDIQPGDNSH